MATPTTRTMDYIRKQGGIVAKAEYWQAIPNHPAGGVRKDLFGFIDIVVLREGKIVAVQATSGSMTSARLAKIKTECAEAAKAWIECGGIIEIWGWRKLKKKVGNQQWFPKIITVEME